MPQPPNATIHLDDGTTETILGVSIGHQPPPQAGKKKRYQVVFTCKEEVANRLKAHDMTRITIEKRSYEPIAINKRPEVSHPDNKFFMVVYMVTPIGQ